MVCHIIFTYMTLAGQITMMPEDKVAKEFPPDSINRAIAFCAKDVGTCPLILAKREDGEYLVKCAVIGGELDPKEEEARR